MSDGYLAIDLQPSRMAAGVVGPDGTIAVRDRLATPARNVWPALAQLVKRVLAANPSDVTPRWAGVTCPGPIDRGTGAMKPVGMPLWHDFPLRRELGALTGLAVDLDTAGRGLALAELWLGETAQRPADEQHVATLVLGDDVDGGLVVAGRLADGLTGNLGQFGHLVVEPGGMPCECGAVGCLAPYASARGIEASINRDLRRTPPAIVERTGIMIGRACATIAALLDVDEIVVGGLVPSVLGAPLFDALSAELEQRSGLDHLADLRVRGVDASRVGPLAAAAAVARQVQERRVDDTPPEVDRAASPTPGEVWTATGWSRPAVAITPAPTAEASPATPSDDGSTDR